MRTNFQCRECPSCDRPDPLSQSVCQAAGGDKSRSQTCLLCLQRNKSSSESSFYRIECLHGKVQPAICSKLRVMRGLLQFSTASPEATNLQESFFVFKICAWGQSLLLLLGTPFFPRILSISPMLTQVRIHVCIQLLVSPSRTSPLLAAVQPWHGDRCGVAWAWAQEASCRTQGPVFAIAKETSHWLSRSWLLALPPGTSQSCRTGSAECSPWQYIRGNWARVSREGVNWFWHFCRVQRESGGDEF